jgi:hypothetical protein
MLHGLNWDAPTWAQQTPPSADELSRAAVWLLHGAAEAAERVHAALNQQVAADFVVIKAQWGGDQADTAEP